MKEIFEVQDELTKKIITAMQVELTWGEQAQVDAKGTNNLVLRISPSKRTSQQNGTVKVARQ